MRFRRPRVSPILALALILTGCGAPAIAPNPTAPNYRGGVAFTPGQGTGHASGGNVLTDLFGGGKKKDNTGGGAAVPVNAYLWRGALDTLSFMPLASADPFGGIIITDWYTAPDAPDERFKATAYILSRALRADGVKLSLFRQVRQNGEWIAAPVDPATVGDIENRILARARQLRVEAKAG